MNRSGITGERCVALFLLGVIAFNPPLLSIFSAEHSVNGIPALYIYFFAAWSVLLVLVGLTARLDKRIDHSDIAPPQLSQNRDN